MEIIEVNTVMAGWFGPFMIVIGILAAVVIIGSIIAAMSDGTDWLGFGFMGILVLGFILFVGGIAAAGRVEPEEMERVQQEVARISGQEITLEEVDSMLDGDPVRGVYYVKDGYDLIVEKEQA